MMSAAAWDCSECTFENAPSFSSCQLCGVLRAVPAAHPGQSFADSSRGATPGQPKPAQSSHDGTRVVDTALAHAQDDVSADNASRAMPAAPLALTAQVSTSSTANAQGWSDTLQGLVEGVVVRFGLDSAWEDVLRDAMLAAGMTTVQRCVDALQPTAASASAVDAPRVPVGIPGYILDVLLQLASAVVTSRLAHALSSSGAAASAEPVSTTVDREAPAAAFRPPIRREPSGRGILPGCVVCGFADDAGADMARSDETKSSAGDAPRQGGGGIMALDCHHLVHRSCLRDHIKHHATTETLFHAAIPCVKEGSCAHTLTLGEVRQCLYAVGDESFYDTAEAVEIDRMMATVEVNNGKYLPMLIPMEPTLRDRLLMVSWWRPQM